MNKCKADASTIQNLKNEVESSDEALQSYKEKYTTAHESQKLAEVKVMELEQRLSDVSTKHRTARDALDDIEKKFGDCQKRENEQSKKVKDLDKENKKLEKKAREIETVSFFIVLISKKRKLVLLLLTNFSLETRNAQG